MKAVKIRNDPKIVVNHPCMLGEGPLWDVENHSIIWVDIELGEIHRYSTATNQHKITKVGHLISAVALKSSGGIVAALENGFAQVDIESGKIEYISQPEIHLVNNRFNDGKCDPAGRFWAGSMDYKSGKGHAGSLYLLDTDYSVSCKLGDVSCSNGLAWSPDHSTMYFVDTPTQQVVAYNYSVRTGEISHKRVIITFPEAGGYPDGMTIDQGGMLWIAFWDGGKVVRYNPHTGERIYELHLPVSRVTSCTFGGDTLEDLYITTARTGLSESALKQQPNAGSLFVFEKVAVKGFEAALFNG